MSTAPALRPRPPRVPFVRPISLRPLDGSRDAQWLLAGNLSLGGCFVRTAKPMPVGSEVKLELEAHGQALPFALAEVVWSRAIGEVPSADGLPGCGLRFKSLSAEARALVMHLIDLGGTGRGQSRTQPLGMTVAPKNPTREPIHAPVALIRDYLNTPPQVSAAAGERLAEEASQASPPPRPTPLRLVPVAPEAVTDPHGMPILDAPSSPSPKIEVDLGALHLEPTESSSFTARRLGIASAHTHSEPWFDQAELQPRRAAEPTFEVASVGPIPDAPQEAPTRRGTSLLASLLAGMAVGGAILGALVLAQKGLRLAQSSASFHGPSLVSFDSDVPARPDSARPSALALDNPPAPSKPVLASAPIAPKVAPREPMMSVRVSPIVVTATVEALTKAPAAPAKEAVAAAPPAAPNSSGTSSDVEIALPTGAAKALRVGGTLEALEVEPELVAGASINHVFSLSGPSRLVIDLDGSAPHGSPRVEGRAGVAGIRLGVRAGGTRLVLDLAQPARHVRTQGNRITVDLN